LTMRLQWNTIGIIGEGIEPSFLLSYCKQLSPGSKINIRLIKRKRAEALFLNDAISLCFALVLGDGHKRMEFVSENTLYLLPSPIRR